MYLKVKKLPPESLKLYLLMKYPKGNVQYDVSIKDVLKRLGIFGQGVEVGEIHILDLPDMSLMTSPTKEIIEFLLEEGIYEATYLKRVLRIGNINE